MTLSRVGIPAMEPAHCPSVRKDCGFARENRVDRLSFMPLRGNPDGTELFDVTFFGFGSGGAPNYRVEAESAKIVNGAWHLRMAKQWPLGISGNPERESVFHEELEHSINPDRGSHPQQFRNAEFDLDLGTFRLY